VEGASLGPGTEEQTSSASAFGDVTIIQAEQLPDWFSVSDSATKDTFHWLSAVRQTVGDDKQLGMRNQMTDAPTLARVAEP
jgi:hypothetical protein